MTDIIYTLQSDIEFEHGAVSFCACRFSGPTRSSRASSDERMQYTDSSIVQSLFDCEQKDVTIAVDEGNDHNEKGETEEAEEPVVVHNESRLLSCWSQKQFNHFKKAYPWMVVKTDKTGQGRLGCSICSQLGNLGCEQQKQMHLSSEWRDCMVSISQSSVKSKQQNAVRKKLFLHQKSDAHKSACKIVEVRQTHPIENHIVNM